jgi:hypothetical protein
VPVVCIEQRLYAHLCDQKEKRRIEESTEYWFSCGKSRANRQLSIHFTVRDFVGEGANITFLHVLSGWFECCSWLRNDKVACAICTRSDVCTVK